MDLRQMRYFVAVATERNLTRAAERLHMAQPPLTRQIRQLEDELGVPLFVRTPKGVDLTPAGQALLDEAPNVLSMAQRAEERALKAGLGHTGRLDVGIFGSGVLNVIPRLLAQFHQERPDVQIRLHTLTKAEQIEALRERRITVGFHRVPRDEDDLAVAVVLREPVIVGLYEGHPLCAQREIEARDMEGERLIVYPNLPIPGLAQEVLAAFRYENVTVHVEQEVEDVLTCVALVSAGFGLCVTAASTASLGLPGMVYRPFRSKRMRDVELSCVYRRSDTSPLLAAFLDVVSRFGGSAVTE